MYVGIIASHCCAPEKVFQCKSAKKLNGCEASVFNLQYPAGLEREQQEIASSGPAELQRLQCNRDEEKTGSVNEQLRLKGINNLELQDFS